MSPRLLVYSLLSLFMISCATIATQSEIDERKKAEKMVTDSFPRDYPIYIERIHNKSGNTEVDYLETAIADIIEGILKPAQKEFAYIELKDYQPMIPDSLDTLVAGTNSIFSDYVTNLPSQITQFTVFISTNTNEVLSGNSNILVMEYLTNEIVTNLVQTNLPHFNKNQYYTFITNEFSGLVDSLSFIPVSLHNNSRDTNGLSISNEFYMHISGDFRISGRGSGPNLLTISLTVKWINEEISTRKITVKCREDQVADKIDSILKELRSAFLNQSTGDMLIITEPDDANIYLDGAYIGKSPVYYPSVRPGPHSLVILKEGYQQGNHKLEIVAGKTNFVSTTISSWETGGVISIASAPTNSQVFVDSLYRGNTPLVLTNLEIQKEHRVKIVSKESGLKPYYENFYLRNKDQHLAINALLQDYEGSHPHKKKAAWILAYSSWGMTLGIIGFNIYAHYEREHFHDLYNLYGDPYSSQLASFTSLEETSFTIGVISGIVSGLVTAYALSTDDLFMGMRIQDNQPVATFGIRF